MFVETIGEVFSYLFSFKGIKDSSFGDHRIFFFQHCENPVEVDANSPVTLFT